MDQSKIETPILLSAASQWATLNTVSLHTCITKQQFHNFCLSRFSYSATSNSLNAYCVKKVSYVLEDGLLGKDLFFTIKKSKLKILHGHFCACPKRRFPGNCLSKRTGPCKHILNNVSIHCITWCYHNIKHSI